MRRSGGFTLTDALVANALLAMLITVSMLVITRTERHDRHVQAKMGALRVAANAIEEILAHESDVTEWNKRQFTTEDTSTRTEYSVDVSVSDDTTLGRRRIVVRTSWIEPFGNLRQQVSLVAWQ